MSLNQSFEKKVLKQKDTCCNEQPQTQLEPKLHLIPVPMSPAPSWSGVAIINLKMKNISLNDYKGKYLILLFYPYDFTFICPTELIQFNDRLEDFHKSDCEIVAISTDSEYSHLAWIFTPQKQGGLGDMKFAVLSDKNHKISEMYGVLIKEEGISLKGLFVIDKDQVIRHITISENCLARSVDEALRILKACQLMDKIGNICPSGPRGRRETSNEKPNYFSII